MIRVCLYLMDLNLLIPITHSRISFKEFAFKKNCLPGMTKENLKDDEEDVDSRLESTVSMKTSSS